MFKKEKSNKLKFFLLPLFGEKLFCDVDHKTRSIFIHIPKTAGVSVSQALYGREIGHRRAKYLKTYNPYMFQKYFKFGFVRNPWDRMVSAFWFLKKGGANKNDKKWASKYLASFKDFHDFVLSLKYKKQVNRVLKWHHFKPQWEYICDDDLQILLDYVGRFEKLVSDFENVKNTLNIACELPYFNYGDHRYYRKYYNWETKEIVSSLYKQDIELFNYYF